MPNTRLFDREKVGVRNILQGTVQVAFDSNGVSSHSWKTQGAAGVSQDLSKLLSSAKSVFELGRPGLISLVSADLSAESKAVVPDGKYWRVIGGFLQYTASSDVATRTPIVTLEPADGAAYATFTLSTKTADQVENDHFLVGSDGNVSGNNDAPAKGTLTLAVNPTAGDTMTIGSVTYTFVAAGGVTANSIIIGGDLAATQAAVEAVLVDGSHPQVVGAAFSLNAMILTARTEGVASDAIATTETFTSGSNVFDATTLGAVQAGVDAADKIATLDYPTAGALLGPGENISLNTTNGHANDAAELAVFIIEYDNDPR